MRTILATIGFMAAAASCAAESEAGAPETSSEPFILVELNKLEQLDGTCRLSFLLENATEADIERLSVETVMFTKERDILDLTVFNLGALPSGMLRVRQFDLAETECEDLGSVLINSISQCEGGDVDVTFCEGALRTESNVEGTEVM